MPHRASAKPRMKLTGVTGGPMWRAIYTSLSEQWSMMGRWHFSDGEIVVPNMQTVVGKGDGAGKALSDTR